MAVVLNGREHRITVEPGPDGRKQFEREIRRLFCLADEDELEFTFDCQAPGSALRPGAKCATLILHFCSGGVIDSTMSQMRMECIIQNNIFI